MTCLNTAGFTAQYFGDAIAVRSATLSQSSQTEDQRSQNIAIAKQAADAATEARKAECGNGDPKQRGKLCRGKEDAEQVALQNLATANAAPIATPPAVASADPAADMINAVSGIPKQWVQYARIGFTTFALIGADLSRIF
jgi:hypothetical protein